MNTKPSEPRIMNTLYFSRMGYKWGTGYNRIPILYITSQSK